MRFFSNDARENSDDPGPDDARDTADDQTERIQSEPVTVPGQRPPSPWATPADDRRDSVPAEPVQSYDDDPDRTQYQPTGYGAVPVAAAVSARDQETAPQPVVTPAGTVQSPTPDNTTTYPGGSATAQDAHRDEIVDVPLDDQGTFDDPKVADETQRIETATTPGDRTADERTDQPGLQDEGGFDDPKAVDPATDEPLRDSDSDSHRDEASRDDAADRSEHHDLEALDARSGDSDTGTGARTEADSSTDTTKDEPVAEPIVAVAVPVAAATAAGTAAGQAGSATGPAGSAAGETTRAGSATGKAGTVPEKTASATEQAFFAEGDVHGFQERWREVQLRFVDSPKEAADEAAKLVDEAVDQLTANLRSHKDKLAGEHDDTEALRVQLRGYRDVLNRILGL